MKRTDLAFAAGLVPLDYLTLLAAAWFAYSLRFDAFKSLLPVTQVVSSASFMSLAAGAAVAWVAALAVVGVYRIRPHRMSNEWGRIFIGASMGLLLVIVAIFFQREFFASRFIILVSWVIAVAMLWIIHGIVRWWQRELLRRGIGTRPIVVIGNDPASQEFVATLGRTPTAGYQVMAVIPDASPAALQLLTDYISLHDVDLVLQADTTISKAQTMDIIDRCIEHAVDFAFLPDTFDTNVGRLESTELGGYPLLAIRRTPLDGWGRILKRTVDTAGALLGLIVFLIPGVIIAIIVKLDSAGPVFVRLDRVGQSQRRFKLWKFRSMVKDAHALKDQLRAQNERADGPLFKMTKDPRITRVGAWLRKTSIDEIPQLINVLRGDMSLVGPRPHEPEEVARYDRHQKKLLAIRPGLTGMAQVSGRSQLTFAEEAKLDTYYIEHWTLGLDMAIIARTPAVVLRGKDAA